MWLLPVPQRSTRINNAKPRSAGNRENGPFVAYFHQAKLDQLREVLVVERQMRSFGGDILHRPSQVYGIKPEAGERISCIFHLA